MATEKLSVIEFAKKRMMEEAKNNEEQSVLYWAAYLDGANAQLREDKSRIADVYPGVEIHECLPCGSYEQRLKAIGKGGIHDQA